MATGDAAVDAEGGCVATCCVAAEGGWSDAGAGGGGAAGCEVADARLGADARLVIAAEMKAEVSC